MMLEPTTQQEPVWLGWEDRDKKRPVTAKLDDALTHYREKLGAPATRCLCHPDHVATLQTAHPDLEIRGVSYLRRHTLYVRGDGDGADV